MKRKAIFLLYRVLQTIGSPAILFYLLLRGVRNPRYFATLRERCGELPSKWQQTNSASIWLHAVSVGEVLAAVPLLAEIKKRAPLAPLFVSTTTLAGRETAERCCADDRRLDGIVDGVFFAPLDFVWAVRRVLRRLRPAVVVVLETEIWPNLFREANRRECGLVIVNGRISDRAFPRYRKFARIFSPVLGLCDGIVTQSEEMRRRFIEAGAQPDRVEAGGNLKYDFAAPEIAPDSPAMQFIRAEPGPPGKRRPLWIAASTSADDRLQEEDLVIEAQRALPGWRLILAPRKPERFEEAARKLDAAQFNWSRRSRSNNPAGDVLLLDSIGELAALFAHADVVFMGGTIADRGGHNILEPALFGKPVIAGPHMENFREIAEHFDRRNALIRIKTGAELKGAILAAAADPELGNRARAAAQQERGSADRAAEAVMSVYEATYPRLRPAQPVYALLWPLSVLWKAGSQADRRRKLARARRLPVPVVSVGNITTGGTGKTPMVMELLRDFATSKPGLLTRGYRRTTRENVLLLEGDCDTVVSRSGDEALLCHRLTRVPTGIGADRYLTGTQLLAAADPHMIFLDDGYQHLQLHRDFDLVLIDGIDPFGGGHLLPLGRLREPMEGLARADAFVVTRMQETPNVKAIESVLRRYNPAAPVFHARIELRHWMGSDGRQLEPGALLGLKAAGFCGLGNSESFWRSVGRTGVSLLDRHAFEDHHRYTPAEIRRLARHAVDIGADALVTTAKDAVNLDPDYASIIAPLKLYWLEIGLDIDRREDLIQLIRAACQGIRM